MHPLYQITKNNKGKRGSFAIVWPARDHVLDREVALKEFWNWAARPIRGRLGFQFAHIRRLTLAHPSLAPVYGADCDRGWLVLEHYPQGSLADRCEPMPILTVRQVIADVLQGLGYLHDKGYIHAAVKPANLFQTATGSVLLSDGLGLRVDAQDRLRERQELFAQLDPAEAKYVSPECLDGKAERLGFSSDLYSLGLTALELLLGEEMYGALFPRILTRAQRWEDWHRSSEAFPSVGTLASELPAELVEVMDGLLRKNPSERITVARALHLLNPPSGSQKKVFRWADKTHMVGPPMPAALVVPDTTPESPSIRSTPPRIGKIFAITGWMLATGLAAWLGWQVQQPTPTPSSQPTKPPDVVQAEPVVKKTPPVLIEKDTPAELGQLRARVASLEGELKSAEIALNESKTEVGRLNSTLAMAQKECVAVKAEMAEARQATDRQAGELLGARVEAKSLRIDLEMHRGRAEQLTEQLKRAEQDLIKIRTELEQSKAAAIQSNAQLKGMQGDIVGAKAESEKHRLLSGKLTEELKQTQVNLSKARMEIEEHKSRLARVQVSKAPWDQLRPVADVHNRTQETVLTTLKALGAKVEVDEKKPEQPVIKLDLTGCKITNDGLTGLEALSSLKTLYLSSTKITDAGLVYLKGLSNLRTLHLYDTQVSDSGLVHLRGLTQLETLYLSSTKVGDVGLAHLKELTNLRSLNLTFTEVSDAGLLHLKGLTRLQSLHLSTTKVGDIGLVHLKDLSQLRSLHLSFTQISDNGLVHLKNLLQLEELHLACPKVTTKGVAELQQALPRCKMQQ